MRFCVTPESYQKTIAGKRAGCTRANEVWTSKSFKFDDSCPNLKAHTEVFFDGPEGYHLVQQGSMERSGNTTQIKSSGTAHFVAADCGTLVPGRAEVVP
jgi:hypothetical protein